MEEQNFDFLYEGEQEIVADENQAKDKKIKNLVSLVILLAGLLAGSITVDVVQLLRGGGFSSRALEQTDVLTDNGRTWVAYNDPIVKLKVVAPDKCENCKTEEVLLSIKKLLPTMVAQKIDPSSEEGKKLATDFELKTYPAFVFSKDIENTEFFAQSEPVLNKKNDQYALNTSLVGLPVGGYLIQPEIKDNDIIVGNKDAKVKIVVFSDFQSPYDKILDGSLKKAITEYGDKLSVIFKQFPALTRKQSESAALSSGCANEQGKFVEYGSKLFEKQDEWGKTTNALKFKDYARQLGLDTKQFNECLDSKKYADKLKADQEEAKKFAFQGTPAAFVNDQFLGGVLDPDATKNYEALKKVIDEELSK